MASNVVSDECYDSECEYNYPYVRRHKHVMTNNGQYVKFIIDKPKPNREISDADTR